MSLEICFGRVPFDTDGKVVDLCDKGGHRKEGVIEDNSFFGFNMIQLDILGKATDEVFDEFRGSHTSFDNPGYVILTRRRHELRKLRKMLPNLKHDPQLSPRLYNKLKDLIGAAEKCLAQYKKNAVMFLY